MEIENACPNVYRVKHIQIHLHSIEIWWRFSGGSNVRLYDDIQRFDFVGEKNLSIGSITLSSSAFASIVARSMILVWPFCVTVKVHNNRHPHHTQRQHNLLMYARQKWIMRHYAKWLGLSWYWLVICLWSSVSALSLTTAISGIWWTLYYPLAHT